MWAQWILISIVGCLSGAQILARVREMRVLSREVSDFLTVCLAPFVVASAFVMRSHPLLAIAMIFFLHATPLMGMFINQLVREHRLRRSLLPFLDEILLKMRTGTSFRESLRLAAQRTRSFASADLQEMAALICFPDQHARLSLLPVAQEVLIELKKIDQTTTRALDRLRSLREKKRLVARFRQKSGQVTGTARAQASVCALLYVGLIGYQAWNQPAVLVSTLALVSYVLFLTGLAALFWIVRRFRWKT